MNLEIKLRRCSNEDYNRTGSCGIASGAKKTEEEFRKVLAAENLDVKVDFTGCVGT